MAWYLPCDQEHTEDLPTLPKQTAWEGILHPAHQRKHRWAAQQGGPRHPSSAHTSLAPGCSTAPAPPESVVGTEGRDVGKMPRQLPCFKDRVATIPTNSMVCTCSLPTPGYSRCSLCHTGSHSSRSHVAAQAAPLDAKDASLLPGLN